MSTEIIIKRLDRIADRAEQHGGADHLSVAIQALEAIHRIQASDPTPKTKTKGQAPV